MCVTVFIYNYIAVNYKIIPIVKPKNQKIKYAKIDLKTCYFSALISVKK